MDSQPTEGREPLVFEVTYQGAGARAYNLDLMGKGRLTIAADGKQFVFSGRQRRFFRGKEMRLSFTPAEIWNVVVRERCVMFSTGVGKTGRKGKAFVFFCRDAGEAMAVASLLPQRIDAAFAEEREFAVKMGTLTRATGAGPSVTNLIVAVNVIVFVVMATFFNAGWIDANLAPYVRFGANHGALTPQGEWWRLVTCMFLHYGIVHIAMNMFALYQVGHLVERLLGRTLYTLLYFGSGIVASLASLIWHHPPIFSAGASGAVFGVYGGLLGCMLRERGSLPKGVFQPIMRSTLLFAGYNILFGLAHPGIDNAAHVGGFLSGLLLGALAALPIDLARRRAVWRIRFAETLVAALMMVGPGVKNAPKFDYNVKDELAWEDLMDELRPRVQAEIDLFNGRLTAYNNRELDGVKLAQELGADFIPFEQEMIGRATALSFRPGLKTEETRAAWLRYHEVQLEALKALQRGVRDGDQASFDNYQRLEAQLGEQAKDAGNGKP